MRFDRYLRDEYFMAYDPVLDDPSEFVYRNPDKREMKLSAKKRSGMDAPIRFMACLKQKILFVWNSSVATHHSMFYMLKSKKKVKLDGDPYHGDYFSGYARLDGDEMWITDCYGINTKFSYKWLEKYFSNIEVFVRDYGY